MLKLIGIILVILAFATLYYGIWLLETDGGWEWLIRKTRYVSIAFLLAMLGIGLITTKESFCEFFSFLCSG